MNFRAILFSIVVFQGMDKMEQVGEHGDPARRSLSSSLYVRHRHSEGKYYLGLSRGFGLIPLLTVLANIYLNQIISTFLFHDDIRI
jgi:hypothetical protein